MRAGFGNKFAGLRELSSCHLDQAHLHIPSHHAMRAAHTLLHVVAKTSVWPASATGWQPCHSRCAIAPQHANCPDAALTHQSQLPHVRSIGCDSRSYTIEEHSGQLHANRVLPRTVCTVLRCMRCSCGHVCGHQDQSNPVSASQLLHYRASGGGKCAPGPTPQSCPAAAATPATRHSC
jgi:hypothetical protein